MKQIILLFIFVVAFIVGVGVYTKDLSQRAKPAPTLPKSEVTIGEKKISVEVAVSEDERKRGLGGRDALPEDDGMLFVFPEKSSGATFWMKDMVFAIDIIWINDTKIVKIDKNVQPEPGLSDEKLTLYRPDAEVNYVLEVAAGFSDKNNISPGDIFLLTP